MGSSSLLLFNNSPITNNKFLAPQLTADMTKGIEPDPSLDKFEWLVMAAMIKYDEEKLQESRVENQQQPPVTGQPATSGDDESSEKPSVSDSVLQCSNKIKKPMVLDDTDLYYNQDAPDEYFNQMLSQVLELELEPSMVERAMKEKAWVRPIMMTNPILKGKSEAEKENSSTRPGMAYPEGVCREENVNRERLLKKTQANEFFGRPFSGVLDISKGERLTKEKSSKRAVMAYPDGISREEVLRRERLLKKPVVEIPRKMSPKDLKRHKFEFDDSDEDYKVKKKNKISKSVTKKVTDQGPNPPPPLPIEFRERICEMGGSEKDAVLVIQKPLFSTDTSSGHNRFSIPLRQVRSEFLDDSEKNYLKNHNGKAVAAMEVTLISPTLEKWKVGFRRWEMKKETGKTSSCYVINSTWRMIQKKNGLKPGMVMQLWAFRVNGELCFALVKLPRGGGGGGGVGSNGDGSGPSTDNGKDKTSPPSSSEPGHY
ncbi:unnamed protein product [Ilex paraguariensis]|uniref:B3 domain-containing protein n=1 Tax=Ilex paraguariensis TaxID=185542 RepID=A0ABC8SSH1_9AQUA